MSDRESLAADLAAVQAELHALQRREAELLRAQDQAILAGTQADTPHNNQANIQSWIEGQARARQERAARIERLAQLDILPEDLRVKAPIDANRRRVSRFTR